MGNPVHLHIYFEEDKIVHEYRDLKEDSIKSVFNVIFKTLFPTLISLQGKVRVMDVDLNETVVTGDIAYWDGERIYVSYNRHLYSYVPLQILELRAEFENESMQAN